MKLNYTFVVKPNIRNNIGVKAKHGVVTFCNIRASKEIAKLIFDTIEQRNVNMYKVAVMCGVTYNDLKQYFTTKDKLHSQIKINRNQIINIASMLGIEIDNSEYKHYYNLLNTDMDNKVKKHCIENKIKEPTVYIRVDKDFKISNLILK